MSAMVGATAENDDKEDAVSESLFCFLKKRKNYEKWNLFRRENEEGDRRRRASGDQNVCETDIIVKQSLNFIFNLPQIST